MANEATITTLLGNQGDPVEYQVAAGTAIPKGSLMEFETGGDPKTVIISTADGKFFAGIAANEKTATDGVTVMACITHCVAECKYSAAGTLGQPQKLSGVNTIADADSDTVATAGEVVGIGLETATTGTGAVLINL
jgi:hypothetical protein